MRLIKPVAAVGVVALMALSACGGGSKNSGTGNAGTNTAIGSGGAAGQGKDPNAKAPAPAIPGAKKGGTVTVLSTFGLQTMDPSEAYYTNTSSILSGLVVRSLTQYEYDDKTKDMVLIPDLATDLGTHNADYTEWKFTLRSGIKYENGKEVTPADIKYGIERSFDRDTFPGGANYSNTYFLDGDKYKGPYKSSGDYKGVTISGQTITIKMAKPFPDMPYWGAFPAMSPIPASGSKPATYRLHPLSTGPYKFSKYTPGQTLTLVKNDQWDPNTDPGRRQYVDQFNFKFTNQSAATDRILIADTGQGQTTLTYDDVQAADFAKARSQASDRMVIGGLPCTFIWYPDNRKIKDKRIRMALAYAYPYRSAWIAGGYIQGVTRNPASAYIAPGVPGRLQYQPPAPDAPAKTDPAKSLALLKQAGYKPGEYKIRFPYATDDPTKVATKNQVVTALKKGGFNPQPYAVADSTKFGEVLQDPNAPVNVRYVGWCSDWPSGASWIPPVFGPGGGANFAYFNNKAVNAKMNAIQRLPLAKQPAAWGALDKEIATTYFPEFVTGYGGVALMHGSKIGGMYDDTTFGMPTWKNMYVK
jgi:peptide/nickel transport system substrate-binding protein